MKLSVVIPTLNRDVYLEKNLRYLAKQSLGAFEWECIVVTQSKLNPEVYLWCEERMNLRIFSSTQKSANHARNIGLFHAQGALVLFLDDDVIVEDNFFFEKCIATILANPGYSGLAGQILTPPLQVPFSRVPKDALDPRTGWLHFRQQYTKKMDIRVGASGNLLVFKEKAILVGGFDSQFDKGAIKEEAEFGLRYSQAWGSLMYTPECSILHIGAPVGGTRSFSTWLRFHHLVGQIYFILISLKNSHILRSEMKTYLLDALRNVFPKQVRMNFAKLFLTSLAMPVACIFSCLKILQGQKLIQSLASDQINLVFEGKFKEK